MNLLWECECGRILSVPVFPVEIGKDSTRDQRLARLHTARHEWGGEQKAKVTCPDCGERHQLIFHTEQDE